MVRGHIETAASGRLAIRGAAQDEAPALHRLILADLAAGQLLPRTLPELTVHATRFVVAATDSEVIGCAELAPLSATIAEVRSLVVAQDHRGQGAGRALVLAIIERARRDRFSTLSAFVHDPTLFVRLGFSMVPRLWIPAKLAADCRECDRFRRCSQYALRLELDARPGRRAIAANTGAHTPR